MADKKQAKLAKSAKSAKKPAGRKVKVADLETKKGQDPKGGGGGGSGYFFAS